MAPAHLDHRDHVPVATLRLGVGDELHQSPAVATEHLDQRLAFGVVGEAARDGTALRVGIEVGGREAERTRGHRLVEQRHELRALVVSRRALPGIRPHHVEPHDRVPE